MPLSTTMLLPPPAFRAGAALQHSCGLTNVHHGVVRCRTLRLHPLEAFPVELNAVTRMARRNRVTVIYLQRLRNVVFKSEPMGFQVTAVGTGGEQMHGDIMRSVACHR